MSTSTDKPTITGDALPGLFASAFEYLVDTGQRSVLFLDVMRQRGVQYREHLAETAPHVLNYAVELILDGRNFKQPVNYALVRVAPPSGVEIDLKRRPFVVVDPRAGHGPGIGGFKADSEIGVAMKAGHPCYFIGFLPEPMPGQTIEDIARAEAIFIEKVIALHPDADGKPCVIGNCQAGWAVMMLASLRPELFGPIIIAGAPLSYWAGVRGKYPMRYSGGLLGGSWLTALTSDLGGGKFDGAWLVQNFENMNPSNTLWTKQYNVYSKVDAEADRYLEFERWWGGHVNLNAEEIQFIVDQLFVGNNLAAGRIKTSDGQVVDLRKISSPIVVFCSKGDNITPPQQALGLDSRSLQRRRRDPGVRPNHRLHRSRNGWAPRNIRLRRRCQERAQRILQQHRPDRCAPARALRGNLRSQIRRYRECGARGRSMDHALRAAHA